MSRPNPIFSLFLIITELYFCGVKPHSTENAHFLDSLVVQGRGQETPFRLLRCKWKSLSGASRKAFCKGQTQLLYPFWFLSVPLPLFWNTEVSLEAQRLFVIRGDRHKDKSSHPEEQWKELGLRFPDGGAKSCHHYQLLTPGLLDARDKPVPHSDL